ncbi:MAG: Trm112 family protein [Woeseiaceae bacterium]|jgi:uncharacterized protein YbaR (Trm112 family)
MEKRLLAILRCPVTRKGLSVLKKDKLEKVNAAIASGDVTTLDGVKVEEPLVSALITDDGKRLYPINDGIPVLLESESIHVEPLI